MQGSLSRKVPGRLGEWQEGNVIGVSERREKVVRNDTSMPTGIRLTDDSQILWAFGLLLLEWETAGGGQ